MLSVIKLAAIRIDFDVILDWDFSKDLKRPKIIITSESKACFAQINSNLISEWKKLSANLIAIKRERILIIMRN